MRTVLVALAALSLTLLTGCTKEDVEDLAGGGNVLEETAEQIVHTVPRTGVKTEIALIRGQLKNYQRMNGGKNPGSLDAMSTLGRLQYPDEYDYDSASGEVTSRTYPEL